MALTKVQLITLHQVLGVPYSAKIYRIKDIDNMLALEYKPAALNHLARLQIQDLLTELEANDVEGFADLETQLDRWYCLFGDSTSMDAGGVGPTTGISFDLQAERNMLRERIVTIVPFSREFMMDEMMKTQKASVNVTAIR